MVHQLAEDLIRTVDKAAAHLRALGEEAAAARTRPGAWSIKEIVGHLVDSAANNHQRFVRAQQASELAFPGYEQDAWVRVQDYQRLPWLELIEFWTLYNHHLAHVVGRIQPAALDARCRIGTNDPVTLRDLIEDYVVHLRHHVDEIEERRAAQAP